jgi:predicted DCC family thiol-disulfide oxidoreductase YuxK
MRIIYFDGICNLCNGFVDFIIQNDPLHNFMFAPLQGQTALKQLSPQDLGLETVIYSKDTHIFRKSAAVIEILYDLGGFYRFCVRLIRWVPISILDQIYDFIAKNRYQLFGQKKTCRLPTESEKKQFLN